MSIEAATAFKTLADQDPALKAEALAAHQAGGMPAVAELAAGRGYAFAPADAETVLAATPAAGELSDVELEGVAGGKGSSRPSPVFNPRGGGIVGAGAGGNIISRGAGGIVGRPLGR